jgi:hypothetical protein
MNDEVTRMKDEEKPWQRRSAAEQFAVAGADSGIVSRSSCNSFIVDGVGGICLMSPEEFEKYKALCASAQMVVLGSETQAEQFSKTRVQPRSHFASAFREIEKLLLSYSHILCEEERDDLLLTLCAKVMPLKEAVLRAEEIWNEGRAQP